MIPMQKPQINPKWTLTYNANKIFVFITFSPFCVFHAYNSFHTQSLSFIYFLPQWICENVSGEHKRNIPSLNEYIYINLFGERKRKKGETTEQYMDV